MDLILITNDLTRAAIAQDAGVDYLMVDLEINGKEARQGHLNTVISRHTIGDVRQMRSVLHRSRLLVRINPLFEKSREEIEACLEAGAEALMLPMFTTTAEVDHFVKLVKGRARTCLLLETPQAFVRADDIARCTGVDIVHVGLNDLHLGMGLTFMFELLTHGLVGRISEQFLGRGIKVGFGGIAPLGQGAVPSELVLSEHQRLGSTQVILSRDFQKLFDHDEGSKRFNAEVSAVRREIERLKNCSDDTLALNAEKTRTAVQDFVRRKSLRS